MATKRDVKNGGVDRARYLRKNQTPSEQRVWSYLRANRLGYKFRRQYPIEALVLDFYCPYLKLAIEVDGEDFHNEADSMTRDLQLGAHGIAVHHILLQHVNDWDQLYPEMVNAIRTRAEYIEGFWLQGGRPGIPLGGREAISARMPKNEGD
jgi:very-short-patch-repair endonuclease